MHYPLNREATKNPESQQLAGFDAVSAYYTEPFVDLWCPGEALRTL